MNGNELAEALLRDAGFSRNYQARKFWMGNVPSSALQELFSWDQLNTCLSFNRITNDRFRLSTAHGHDAVNKRAFRPVKDGFGRQTDYLVISELHKLMKEGVTAVLEAVNELSPSVAELTEFLGGRLGARSAANAYISFGEISGFGAHNDDHDVVVLQLDGRKHWQFFRAPTHSEKATVRDMAIVSQAELGEEVIVSAGDAMFIPKGTWHNVAALNEKSLHLTVSLVYPTMADFITWGMQQHRYDAPFEDIRPSGDREGLASVARDFFDGLISRENLETFLNMFHAARASSRIRADFPSLNTPSSEDAFRRIAFDTITLTPSPSSSCEPIEVYALGHVHLLTHAEHALLQELPTVRAVDGEDIADAHGGWDRVAPILQSLLDKGLVGKIPCDSQAFVETRVTS